MTLEQALAAIAVFVTVISVFISLVTASSAARRGAFEDLQKVVELLKEENKKLSLRVDGLEVEVKERDNMIDDLKNWAERLVEQVKAAGLDPVPFKKRRVS